MAVDIDDLLLKRLPVPPCEGPKLKAFRHTPKETQFLRLLSCDPDSEESETGSGYVFEVGIGEKRFALKVFKFFDIEESQFEFPSYVRRRVSGEVLTFHSDPSSPSAEPTVKRKHRGSGLGSGDLKKRQLAVPCYGYITIAAQYERLLQKKFNVWNWNRSEEEELGQITRKPFRALVKELVISPVSVLNPRRMLGDLKKLRKLEIFVRDVHARNYKAGFLVDFSVAWTAPHWGFVAMGPRHTNFEKIAELGQFDEMIKSKGIKTVVRARRNWGYCRKLRSWDNQDDSVSSSAR
ncbi:kinetochore Sim4 complex subunit FTA2-domain-containing protein [Nemania serpens]|nr:kinetochore Sim4 complex subunit FTA2-domain-containing protein [Nemania serpens]